MICKNHTGSWVISLDLFIRTDVRRISSPSPKSKQLKEKNTPSSLLQNAGPVDEDTAPSPCAESCHRTRIIEGLQWWHLMQWYFKLSGTQQNQRWVILSFFCYSSNYWEPNIFWMPSMNPIARTPRKSSGSFDAEEIRQNLSARYAVMDEDLQEKRVEGSEHTRKHSRKLRC